MDILLELIFNLFTVRKTIREDYNKLTSVQKIIYYLLWIWNFGLAIVLNILSYMDMKGEYDFKFSTFCLLLTLLLCSIVITVKLHKFLNLEIFKSNYWKLKK